LKEKRVEHLEISSRGNFELTAHTEEKKERLVIRGAYPNNELSRFLFMQLGLVYLLAPHLPKTVAVDFPVFSLAEKLIHALYQSEGERPPALLVQKNKKVFQGLSTKKSRAVVAHSGGKDSLWNMWWAQQKYLPHNVLCLHIKGLSKSNARDEFLYAQKQARECPFSHFDVIDLLDSSSNRGYQVMRAREFFMTGIMIPYALQFGSSWIITEGDAEAPSYEPLSGTGTGVRLFNNLIADIGIPVEVTWRNQKEMDVVKDLLIHKPTWLPLVCNCFSPANYRVYRRSVWARNAPSFPLYESQCGSCVKCRIINVARILHDTTFSNVCEKDIRYFLENTSMWLRRNRNRLSDMVEGSFLESFEEALRLHPITRS
jgi:hypothetical protein